MKNDNNLGSWLKEMKLNHPLVISDSALQGPEITKG